MPDVMMRCTFVQMKSFRKIVDHCDQLESEVSIAIACCFAADFGSLMLSFFCVLLDADQG